MHTAHSLLTEASKKLIELHADSRWALQLPTRCPPVLWFGNANSAKRKIITVGANPSRQEFLADSSARAMEKVRRSGNQSLLLYLEPPDQNRFRVLSSNERLADILSCNDLREQIIDSYNIYFTKNPYWWFGKNKDDSYNVEGFLRGFGASYYDGKKDFLQAIHIDLVPFATLDDFGRIRALADLSLFADEWARTFVARLVEGLSPEALILFGRANCGHFGEYIDESVGRMRWNSFGSGEYFVGQSERFNIPVVGLSTNLGNPKGFDRATLRAYGASVRKALRIQ